MIDASCANFLFCLMLTLDTILASPNSRIINIKVHKQLSKDEVLQFNLPVQLDGNLQFTDDLISAYDYYMQKQAALIYR